MKQSNSKNRVIRNVAVCALLTAATCCTSLGVKFLSNVTAEAGTTLVFQNGGFTATENYKYLDYAYANETTLTDAEKTMTGTLVRANKTGTDAEGASFAIKETQTENFSMDFRVFSQTTYKHDCYRTSTHYNTSVASMQADEYNPFLDLKEVQFTFTSVSDTTQSVSLFVRGSENYKAYGVTAYVGSQTGLYPTAIANTSFSNFNAKDYSDGQETTNYNSVTFNKTTGVIAVNNTTITTLDASALAKYADGYTVSVTYSDVTANDSTGNELAQAFNAREVEQGLSPTNFGVDLTYVQGKEYKYNQSANGFADYAGNRYGPNMGYSEGVGEAYERNAQMLVYNVNGQSVGVDGDGNAETKASALITTDSKLTATDNQTNKVDGNNGLLISSEGKASGEDAKDAYFYFNDTMNGEFDMDFRVTSEKTYKPTAQKSWGSIEPVDKKYAYDDGYNPYADVKEVAFTFISATDSSKWFTVYLHNGGITLPCSNAYATTARVRVSGDTYGVAKSDSSLIYGYGLNYKTGTYSQGYQFTDLINTSFSNFAITNWDDPNNGGWAWRTPAPIASNIRFDPVEMKVYARGGDIVSNNGNLYTERAPREYLVRDLTNNEGVAWGKDVYWKKVWSTLTPEDFAGGYTVSVQFTSMTNDETIAQSDTTKYKYDDTNGCVNFDTPYDRNINMTIYSLNGTNFGSVGSKITDTESANLSAPTKMNAFVENDITPLYFDVIDGDTIPENGYGKVYVSTDNKASWSEVEKNAENKYLYTPSVAVKEYFVKYEGFADSVGNVTPTKEYAVAGVYSGFNMVGGASVRLASGDAGIRFTARMDKSVYEGLATAGLSNVKFFFEVTVTYDKNGVETSKTLAKEVSVDNIYENGDFMQMTASITDLTSDMYDYKWSAKAYMSFEKNGDSGVLYAKSYDNTRTVRNVALSALVDHEDDSYGISYGDTDLAILKSLAGLA